MCFEPIESAYLKFFYDALFCFIVNEFSGNCHSKLTCSPNL